MSQIFMQLSYALVYAFAVMILHANAQGQDQSADFISIDCGLQPNLGYIQSTTTIRYTPDADYITTGEARAISRANNPEQQFWFIRVFPEGTRNCYKINIKSGLKYLLRASFMYGNYDGENNVPEFELHLGADLWDSVVFTPQTDSIVKELIYVPVRDYIQVCLINVNKGVPFISAIEIRRLRFDAYQTEVGSSLALLKRINMAENETVYRYPYDVNDRIWAHEFIDGGREVIAATTVPDDQSAFELPSLVMRTAAKPPFPEIYLNMAWAPGSVDAGVKNSSYYFYMHFAEVEDLMTPTELTLRINGDLIDKSFIPVYLNSTTKNSSFAADIGEYNFSVNTPDFSPAPFLNAYEIYVEKNFTASETYQQDIEAITSIKATYNIVKNWQGDPCNPKIYIWEGVMCSYPENNSSRIVSLDLSSSGLTGDIADSIANLTMIQTLDLSDNKLSGQIPDYLSKLSKLNIINLDQNELTGSVPAGLIAKTNNGLSLSLCGNPSLTGQVPCKKKKTKFLIPIIASVAAILLVLFTTAAILWNSKTVRAKFKKWRTGVDPENEMDRKGHDVFLSFRGVDTRASFARNLYEALMGKRIKTFFDDEDLERGGEISDLLLQAIEESDISIVLFSENYATSSWYLDELAKIIECKKSMDQRVIPVFYKVEPTNVRHGKLSFDLKEGKHKDNINVPKWQTALEEVATLAGYPYNEGYESKMIEKIVDETLEAKKKKKEESLERFASICPPDGEDDIVIYVTEAAEHKDFKNCQKILQSLSDLKLKHFQQRDVKVCKKELKKLMNKILRTPPCPQLFVKGKYVGGYDEVERFLKERWFREALRRVAKKGEAATPASLNGQEEAGGATATSETSNVGCSPFKYLVLKAE